MRGYVMIYIEEYGDLFQVDKKYYLCHCISSDFALGKGIAVEFNKRYNMRAKLTAMYMVNAVYAKALLVDNVFNLVTKEKYWHKPTYTTLTGALEDMRKQTHELGIHYLAMPMIGAGLDRLNWDIVSQKIQEIFKNEDIEIKVIKRK